MARDFWPVCKAKRKNQFFCAICWLFHDSRRVIIAINLENKLSYSIDAVHNAEKKQWNCTEHFFINSSFMNVKCFTRNYRNSTIMEIDKNLQWWETFDQFVRQSAKNPFLCTNPFIACITSAESSEY